MFQRNEVLRGISAELKKAPFHTQISLVELADLDSSALLALCTGVCSYLYDSEGFSPDQLSGGRILAGDKSYHAKQLLNVAKILKYPFQEYSEVEFDPVSKFETALFSETDTEECRNVLIRLLHFLLKDLDSNSTRIYLSKYLSRIHVPEELSYDPNVRNWIQKLNETQDRFKSRHRLSLNSQKSMETTENPLDLKQNLLTEISQLKLKLNDNELSGKPDFEALLSEAMQIRKIQAKTSSLSTQEKKQQLLQAQYLANVEEYEEELKVFRLHLTTGSPSTEVLSSISKKNKQLTLNVTNARVKYKNKQVKHDDIMYKVSQPKRTEDDVENLEFQISALTKQNASYKRKIEDFCERKPKVGAQLKILRQQTSLLINKLKMLQNKQKSIRTETEKVEGEILALPDTPLHTKNTMESKKISFAEYAAILRNKNLYFIEKSAKKKDLEAELVVLSQTAMKLQKECPEFDVEVHRESSVSSNAKHSSMDLEALSQRNRELESTVNSLNQQIHPFVKEMKELKATLNMKRKRHHEAQVMFMNLKKSIEIKKSTLLSEISELEDDYGDLSSKYYTLSNHMKLCRLRQEQAKVWARSEKEAKNDSLDILEKKILQQQQNAAELSKQEKAQQQSSSHNIKQSTMFKNMKALLEIRKACANFSVDTSGEHVLRMIDQR